MEMIRFVGGVPLVSGWWGCGRGCGRD